MKKNSHLISGPIFFHANKLQIRKKTLIWCVKASGVLLYHSSLLKWSTSPCLTALLAGPTNYEQRTKVVPCSHGATAVKMFRFAPSVRRRWAQKGLLNRVRNLSFDSPPHRPRSQLLQIPNDNLPLMFQSAVKCHSSGLRLTFQGASLTPDLFFQHSGSQLWTENSFICISSEFYVPCWCLILQKLVVLFNNGHIIF